MTAAEVKRKEVSTIEIPPPDELQKVSSCLPIRVVWSWFQKPMEVLTVAQALSQRMAK